MSEGQKNRKWGSSTTCKCWIQKISGEKVEDSKEVSTVHPKVQRKAQGKGQNDWRANQFKLEIQLHHLFKPK